MRNLLLNRLFLRYSSEWLAFGCALFLQNILRTAILSITLLINSPNTGASSGLRIISLAPDLTEIVYALGLENYLVGVSDYSDFPEAAGTKPSVGSFIAPNLEKILLLNPSVVLAQSHATPSQITQTLQARKISVLFFEGRSEEDLYNTLQILGQKFNKEKRALNLISSMKSSFLKIKKSNSQKPSVLVQIEETPLMVAGRDTLIDRAIILAGGKNAAKDYIGYPKLQREALLKLNPDIVILPETKGQEQKLKRMAQSYNRAWGKNKTPVIILPGDLLTRATPRFCEGVQKLATALAQTQTP